MRTYKLIFLVSLALAFAACKQDDTIYQGTGYDLGGDELFSSTITVRGERTIGNKIPVVITRGEGSVTENIFAYSSAELSFPETVLLNVNEKLIDKYNSVNGTSFSILPSEFYSFGDGNTITVETGKISLNTITIYETNVLGNVLEAGDYLLPLDVFASASNVSNEHIYVVVVVREQYEGLADLYQGDELFFVFYVNTNEYDPRIITDYCLSKKSFSSSDKDWYCAIGNILNLRVSTISYDENSKRAIFAPSADLYYILNNYDKYILPIQETGIKVCISIEGKNSGLGFCNLTDEQIDDFVSQVKFFLDTYPLDGINLWDQNSGYGMEGMPKMNTTSYPKLIQKLRDTFGYEKLLTITDYMEPTEYFWDTNATGGISVGEYIDYAWSGYNKNRLEFIQIVDPYHQGNAIVSSLYPRKPIAGLDPSKYGCINAPWNYLPKDYVEIADENEMNLFKWNKDGMRQSNILVFEDIRTNLQDEMEQSWYWPLELLPMTYTNSMFSFEFVNLTIYDSGWVGFNKWLKDW